MDKGRLAPDGMVEGAREFSGHCRYTRDRWAKRPPLVKGDRGGRVRSDDEDWSEALFRDHFRRVALYALRHTYPDDAADVVASTFAIAWRKLATVPAGGEALPWLLATARRVLANQHRSPSKASRPQTLLGQEGTRPWLPSELGPQPGAEPSGKGCRSSSQRLEAQTPPHLRGSSDDFRTNAVQHRDGSVVRAVGNETNTTSPPSAI